MPIYKNGVEYSKAYKGDHRPVNIYKGNNKIAGWHTETKSDQQLTFTGTYNDTVTNLIITGNTIQNGTPDPDNPIPITGVSGHLVVRTEDNTKQYELPLPQKLNKIGDVADTYNPVTGEYVQRVGVKVFDGTEDISTLTFSHEYSWIKPTNSSIPARTGNIMCSHFAVTTSVNAVDIGTMRAGVAYLNFNFDNGVNGIAHFKTWLADQYTAGTPVTVCYILNEPVTTYLDPMQIPTYYQTTIIETDSTVAPAITATVKVMD